MGLVNHNEKNEKSARKKVFGIPFLVFILGLVVLVIVFIGIYAIVMRKGKSEQPQSQPQPVIEQIAFNISDEENFTNVVDEVREFTEQHKIPNSNMPDKKTQPYNVEKPAKTEYITDASNDFSKVNFSKQQSEDSLFKQENSFAQGNDTGDMQSDTSAAVQKIVETKNESSPETIYKSKLQEKQLLAEKIFMPILDIDARYWVLQILNGKITREQLALQSESWVITSVYRGLLLNKIDFILRSSKVVNPLSEKEKSRLNWVRRQWKREVAKIK